MSVLENLKARADSSCELCFSKDNLVAHLVSPKTEELEDNCALVCSNCLNKLENPDEKDNQYWKCLSSSLWNGLPAVQVLIWRQLNMLKNENFAADLLTQLYLEDDVLSWAKQGLSEDSDILVKDSNGARLLPGDSVTLIKDLVVKGANFTAKRGTLVKNISLTNNPEHIEGKVGGVQIVLVASYLKKVIS
jgi:protein PhnA